MTPDYTLPRDRLVISLDELKGNGLSLYKINRLVADGSLTKLTKKYYKNNLYKGGCTDLCYVPAYAPSGIVCLMSAAFYYKLSSHRPEAIDVAIPRKARLATIPESPKLKVHYYAGERYLAGVTEAHDGANTFKIYDIEKTVSDIVYYREKVGKDAAKEVMVNYVSRETASLDRLVSYAKRLKCAAVMKNYLDMLT